MIKMAEYDIVKDVGTKTETVEKSAKRKCRLH